MSEEFDDGDDADERVVPHTLLLSQQKETVC